MSTGPWTLPAGGRGARLKAAATQRNREPIAEVLKRELPETGMVLELASGTGEHAAYFSALFPRLTWQPSDADPAAMASIDAWRNAGENSNFNTPLHIDVTANRWPISRADAIFCANMLHISPWSASAGLFRGAARLLAPGAPLVVYGPFLEPDRETADSNKAFDADLRARNPEWGLRDVRAVDELAVRNGLARTAQYEMPANNVALVWRVSP